MSRVNERCFQYTPEELKFNSREISPGKKIKTALFDVRGAKVFVMWVQVLEGTANAHFEYIAEDEHTLLQVTEARDLVAGKMYNRFQFGTYGDAKIGRAELPALYLRLVIENAGEEPIKVTARGMSQLQ